MLLIAVRTLIMYALVLLAIRIMGKSELSKMSPFQMVITFMIAELAAIPIDNPSVSVTHGIIGVLTLTFLQIILSLLSIKSEGFKNLISGKPSILIENGKLNIKEMRKLRITITDLMEQLRLENCPSICNVQYAIMESNGQLTVIPKADTRPVTAKDMHLAVTQEALPVILVSDGTVYQKNLWLSGLTEEDFQHRLSAKGFQSYKEIFLAFCDEKENIHVYLNSRKTGDYAQEILI